MLLSDPSFSTDNGIRIVLHWITHDKMYQCTSLETTIMHFYPALKVRFTKNQSGNIILTGLN